MMKAILLRISMHQSIFRTMQMVSRWIDIRLNSIKKTIVRKIPRTEKQPRMVQQVKYAPQLTYITKYEDLFDDEGKAVIVDGKNYKSQ